MQWRGVQLSKKEGLEAFLLVVSCKEGTRALAPGRCCLFGAGKFAACLVSAIPQGGGDSADFAVSLASEEMLFGILVISSFQHKLLRGLRWCNDHVGKP